jgi:hypothetical protein
MVCQIPAAGEGIIELGIRVAEKDSIFMDQGRRADALDFL